jgi:hypothetical protein
LRNAASTTLLLSAALLLGCETDLGECDMATATKLVYSPSGVPYYEGQALVHQSCANGVCHSAGAKGNGRIGVPHGLNFDVQTLQPMSTPTDLAVLQSGVDRIREEPGELYDLVDSGEMPPGNAGKRIALAWRTLDANMKPTVATGLPSVRGNAGKEVLRNWLACDAPVVAGVKGAPAGAETLGDILDSAATTIEPTFSSIFENVLSDACVGCHNGALFTDEQALDFSTLDAAFDTMVGKDAFATGACAGAGKLVAAGGCESSVLYQKLAGEGQSGAMLCGLPMPATGPMLSADALAAVCEWIDKGAAK